MPKMKTHKGAKARVSVTGSGKLRRRQQMRGHLFVGKTAKHKRKLARETDFAPGDAKFIKRMLAGSVK